MAEVEIKERATRCVEGAWIVFRRDSDFNMQVLSVHAEELEARRIAMNDYSLPLEVVFVKWGFQLIDPLDKSPDSSTTTTGEQ